MPPVDPGARANLHAPLLPRRGRLVAYPLVVAVPVGSLVLAAVLPATGPGGWQPADRAMVVAFGLAVAWFLYRLGSVRALPSEQGIVVRNLLITRRLEWAEIVSVNFGGGNPWAILDLDDGDTLAVMAVQRADGPAGIDSARRLATLVALHSDHPIGR